jgi:hypothetical protein
MGKLVFQRTGFLARVSVMWLSPISVAEIEGHHPDISFGWGCATVSLSTKKIKGLHENDFIMASKIRSHALVISIRGASQRLVAAASRRLRVMSPAFPEPGVRSMRRASSRSTHSRALVSQCAGSKKAST